MGLNLENMFGDVVENNEELKYERGNQKPTKTDSYEGISKTTKVIGYIAEKKNSLTEYYDVDAVKEATKKAFEAMVAEGKSPLTSKTGSYFELTAKKFENGAYESTTKTVKLSEKGSGIRSLMAYDTKAYEELTNKGIYKVNLNEAKAKYYIIKDSEIEEALKSNDSSALMRNIRLTDIKNAGAISAETSASFIISDVSLISLLLATETFGLDVVNRKGKVVGLLTASRKNVKKNDIPQTVNVIQVFNSKSTVEKGGIGYLGDVPYLVNRNYTGAVPTNVTAISNEKTFKELFPNSDPKRIGIYVKPTKMDGKVTFADTQNIAWKELEATAKQLGVTEQMITDLRGKKKSKESTMTIAQGQRIFTRMLEDFRKKNSESVL